jgi:hypothetical protein
MDTPGTYRAALRKVLTEQFTADELRGMCFDLGIDDEMIQREPTKDGLARAMIWHCEKDHAQFTQLINAIRVQRPNIDVNNISLPNTLTQASSQPQSQADYYFSKGLRAHIKSDLWEARRYYKIALEIDPHYPLAAQKLYEVNKLLGPSPILDDFDDELPRASPSRLVPALIAAILLLIALCIVIWYFMSGSNIPMPPIGDLTLIITTFQ